MPAKHVTPASTDSSSGATPTATANSTETATTVPTVEAAEVGWRVAGQHLRLAVHALLAPLTAWIGPRLHPLLSHLPRVAWATRLYLLNNIMLYGVVTCAFLWPTHAFAVGRTGLALVDGPVPHAIWGLGALAACLSQVAALLSTRWSVWQTSAVLIAMWASAWMAVTLLLAHAAGIYGGVVLWLWIVIVHFLFIANKLVPAHDHLTTVYDPQVRVASAAHDEEEQALLQRLEREMARPAEYRSNGHTPPVAVPAAPH